MSWVRISLFKQSNMNLYGKRKFKKLHFVGGDLVIGVLESEYLNVKLLR